MSPAAPVRRAEEEGCSRQVEEGRMPSDGRGVVAGEIGRASCRERV